MQLFNVICHPYNLESLFILKINIIQKSVTVSLHWTIWNNNIEYENCRLFIANSSVIQLLSEPSFVSHHCIFIIDIVCIKQIKEQTNNETGPIMKVDRAREEITYQTITLLVFPWPANKQNKQVPIIFRVRRCWKLILILTFLHK